MTPLSASMARSVAAKGTPASCGEETADHEKLVSGPEFATTTTSVRVSDPTALNAVMVRLNVPDIKGVPLITPVPELMERPGGRGDAS